MIRSLWGWVARLAIWSWISLMGGVGIVRMGLGGILPWHRRLWVIWVWLVVGRVVWYRRWAVKSVLRWNRL